MRYLLSILILLISNILSAQNNRTFFQCDVSYILEQIIPKTNAGDHNSGKDYDLWRSFLSRPHPSVKLVEDYFNNAAEEFGVPAELLKAIGQVENNWTQIGPSIDRGWGIMHLVKNDYCNTLDKAAELLDTDTQILKDDPEQNIRGAAALIVYYAGNKKEYFIDPGDWFEAIKRFTGLINEELREKQAERYYRVLKEGIRSRTLWNEYVVIYPHPGISIQDKLKYKKDTEYRSPDYPPAIWNVNTQSPNYYSRDGYDIDTWVNHWIGVGTYAGAISWFQHPDNNNSSAHFVIRASDGEISQCVLTENGAWHCGASGYPANNRRSIGIEHEATASNPDLWNSAPMLEASTTMACFFCDLYDIPPVRDLPGIMGHQEMPGCATDCPGNLPWDTWMGLLGDCITDIEDHSGVADINSFYIYPNPFNNELTIIVQNNKYEHTDIRILDAIGRDIYSKNISVSDGTIRLADIPCSLPGGIYLLILTSDNKSYSFRLIKK